VCATNRCGSSISAARWRWWADVAAALAPSPATLSAQDALLRRLAPGVDAILPARFGTLLADDAALVQALAPRRGELAEALARVAGCEQMTLRVWGDRAAPIPEPERAGPDPAPATWRPAGVRVRCRKWTRCGSGWASWCAASAPSVTIGRRCWPPCSTWSRAAGARAISPRSTRLGRRSAPGG
jgi:hypothetical protein